MSEVNENNVPFFEKVDLVCCKIAKVQRHEDAEKLYILTLDDGDEGRTIVSSLVDYYKEEELDQKTIVVVGNLKPANFRGVKSHGMLLATSVEKEDKKEEVEVFFVDAQPGSRVSKDPNQMGRGNVITKKVSINTFGTYQLEMIDGVAHLTEDGQKHKLYINGKEFKSSKIMNGKIG